MERINFVIRNVRYYHIKKIYHSNINITLLNIIFYIIFINIININMITISININNITIINNINNIIISSILVLLILY